jgi:hypothetical protein
VSDISTRGAMIGVDTISMEPRDVCYARYLSSGLVPIALAAVNVCAPILEVSYVQNEW